MLWQPPRSLTHHRLDLRIELPFPGFDRDPPTGGPARGFAMQTRALLRVMHHATRCPQSKPGQGSIGCASSSADKVPFPHLADGKVVAEAGSIGGRVEFLLTSRGGRCKSQRVACTAGGCICVLQSRAELAIERFTEAGRWEDITRMPFAQDMGCDAVAIGHMIYLIGGYSARCHVAGLELHSLMWSLLPPPPSSRELSASFGVGRCLTEKAQRSLTRASHCLTRTILVCSCFARMAMQSQTKTRTRARIWS